MDEKDTAYYASRRRFFQFVPAEELQAILECRTDAEIGRYFRARIMAEQAGFVTEEAKKIAGKGAALKSLERAERTIVEDVERYRNACEQRKQAIRKRWDG